jgi:PAS domain S-box-containing protein
MTDKNVPQLIEALEAFEDGIYITTKNFKIIYMNQALKKNFGNGVGKTCYEFISKRETICPWCHHEKIFEKGNNHYEEIFVPGVNKSFYSIEVPVTNADGSRAKMTVLRDISEKKQQEEKLKISEQDYKRLFEHAGSGVFISSKEGRFLDVNPALLKMLGYTEKSEFLKIDLATDLYLKREHRMAYQQLIEEKGSVVDYEVKWRRKDGAIIEVLLTSNVRCDSDDNILGYEGVVVDLGERLRMERKLYETRQQLLQSEKLAAMGRLTSQIAHELNNPLFGIMNTLELMKTEITPQNKRRRLLDLSLDEAGRLAEMLKKMLSFSRPDQMVKVHMNINSVVEEIILLYEKSFKENNIYLKTSLEEDLSAIYASKDQMRQLFLNMLSNSKDAMPDGGTLEIETRSVDDTIQIIIADNGSGIAEEHIGKIFDSFFTTKRDRVKGVGLGLSVCYQFIKDHDGDISVDSKPGEGTTFVITLPVSKDAPESIEPF